MPISGIQGHLLQVTVVRCDKLKNTGWVTKQSPYVCVEYCGHRLRTKSCKDGGTEPNFNEKFEFSLVEGRQEINVEVWTSHNFSSNEKIGRGTIKLEQVLTDGYDDKSWPLWGESVRHGQRSVGEVYLILHYSKAKKSAKPQSPPPPCVAHQVPICAAHPQSSTTYNPPLLAYPPGPSYNQLPPSGYPPGPFYPQHHYLHPSPSHGRQYHGVYPPQH